MDCRICSKEADLILNLGNQPLANALLKTQDEKSNTYPLKFYFCESCQYGMTDDRTSQDIFDDSYPYYTSVNTSYVEQCRKWAESYKKTYNPLSVLEIGSNDGYMLQNFKNIHHIGFEPSFGPHEKAMEKGINSENSFFGLDSTEDKFDLIIANNVIAHNPNLRDLVHAIARCLSIRGRAVIEFPTLENLIEKCQYDTIYQEHYSYFSLHSISLLFRFYGMYLAYYEVIPSHGGSIRAHFSFEPSLPILIHPLNMKNFKRDVFVEKLHSLDKMIQHKKKGNKMALFGAAAKGNTFLNYLGVGNDFFDYCVDETPAKQGKFLPGSRIPIYGIEKLKETKPDVIWILPWNFKDEIIKKLSFAHEWNAKFEVK